MNYKFATLVAWFTGIPRPKHSKTKMVQSYVYVSQVLLAVGIILGSQCLDLDSKQNWVISIARYIIYILTLQASKAISALVYKMLQRRRLSSQLFSTVYKHQLVMYTAAAAVVYIHNQKLYAEDLLLILIAYLIVKYPEINTPSGGAVTVGACIACTYIEGYLVYIIPPDGMEVKSFQDKLRAFESYHGVVFPVKRIFVIVTKTMYCPPDLKEFNDKSDRKDVNRLEACTSLEGVVKDVAGVKNRKYMNSAYKIIRPNKPPVYVTAEGVLHTLYKATQNKLLSDELAGVNVEDIVWDFVSTLRAAVAKYPELRNYCEVVYFDNTDESLNLSDVLLDRIRELEPDFENFIASTQ